MSAGGPAAFHFVNLPSRRAAIGTPGRHRRTNFGNQPPQSPSQARRDASFRSRRLETGPPPASSLADQGRRERPSPLPLLVPRVVAQDEDHATPADHLTLFANPLDACPNLHHTRDAIASHLTALGKPIDLDTLKPWSIVPGGRPSQVVDVFLGLVREIWPKTSEIPDEGDRTASLPSRLTHVLPPVAGMTRRVRRLRAER